MNDADIPPYAVTWLFVPGTRPDRFAKAAECGADEIVIDLEDAVAPPGKEAARRDAADWLDAGHAAWVRINAPGTPWYDDDLRALGGAGTLRGVIVPKAERPGDLAATADRIPSGARVVALIETARGVANAQAVAHCDAVSRLAFGSVDFALDLGIDADGPDETFLLARSTLAIASRAAGKAPPIDGVTLNLSAAAASRDARRARALGFGGKLLIHPAQVAPVTEAFAPTTEQIRWAHDVLDPARGHQDGDVFAEAGQMIDRPVLDLARQILRSARP